VGQAVSTGRRRLLSLGLGVAIAAVLWVALTAFGTGGNGPERAAHFSLPRLGGGPPVTLPIAGAGAHEPVVLTFFASWCGPCHAELPKLARVAGAARAAGTRVAFLGIDGNDDPVSGLAFARTSGVTFPVADDADSTVAPTYGLDGYPGTVFIDATGHVAATVHGPVTVATLRSWLASIAPS